MSEPAATTGTDAESAVGADKLAGPQDVPPTGVATKPEAPPENPDAAGLVEIATKPFWVRHYTFTGTNVVVPGGKQQFYILSNTNSNH